MKLTQSDRILKAMVENKWKRYWDARDFQSGKWFVGYEASARISELINIYPWLFEINYDGRFRQVGLKWKECKKEIKELQKAYKEFKWN